MTVCLKTIGFILFCLAAFPPTHTVITAEDNMSDKSMENLRLKRLTSPDEFCTFGPYATSPESPDGSRIVYTKFPEKPTDDGWNHRAEVWISDHDGGNHRKLADCGELNVHNGAEASWVNNQLIVANRVKHQGKTGVAVIDAEEGEVVHGPIEGAMYWHEAHEGRILLGVNKPGGELGQGLWVLDAKSGETEHLARMEDFHHYADSMDTEDDPENWTFAHPEWHPDGSLISVMVFTDNWSARHQFFLSPQGEIEGFFGQGSGKHSGYAHPSFYDDTTLYGYYRGKTIRANLEGEEIKTIGGEGIHPDLSPNRRWVAGEARVGNEDIIYAYPEGSTRGIEIDRTPHIHVTRELGAHINPSWNYDGTRLYYLKGNADGYAECWYAELEDTVVGNIDDESALAEIASTASNPRIRRIALRNITDPGLRAQVGSESGFRKIPKLDFDVSVDGDLSQWADKTHYIIGSYESEEGLDAQIYAGWDESHFYLAAEVKNEEHFNENTGESIWDGDCLQFAIDPLEEGGEPFNVGFARASGKPRAHQWMGADTELLEKSEYDVVRDETNGVTSYEIKIPFECLGIEPSAGTIAGFNTVIFNDADGEGFDYWIELTPGIAGGWEPEQFNLFQLSDSSLKPSDPTHVAMTKISEPGEEEESEISLGGVNAMAGKTAEFDVGEVLYENPLSAPEDIEDVVIESSKEDQPEISFSDGKMRLKSDVHFLFWFPEDFPDNIAVSWDFLPHVDDGLAMFWFSAKGREGEDLFDPSLQERTGDYSEYNKGDINAYHVAYFRRNPWDDPHINTVNLRKSYGHHLVALGPNPIPNVEQVKEHIEEPYRITLIKYGPHIRMKINGLTVLDWIDDGEPHRGGKIGFRQMANLAAEYSNLKVRKVEKVNDR